MKTNIFMPKQINVGFVNRNDTYTGKLAYIIYFDEKGKLRKEASWNGWRDSKIDNEIFDNEPTSGFVLNKKAGGYDTGWNHRQTYVRVYDPRGFEFEISVPNLLYILENTNSIKGKGLEGDFVYAWDGTDLVLVPVDSPDYKAMTEYNAIVHANEFIKAKDLKIGATYLTKDNEELIFMGKFDEYNYSWRHEKAEKKKGKSFYFYTDNCYSGFRIMKAVTRKLISVVSEECVENYAELFDKMECNSSYSPIDHSKDKYLPYTLEEIRAGLENNWRICCYDQQKDSIDFRESRNNDGLYTVTKRIKDNSRWGSRDETYQGTLEDLFNAYKPTYKNVYLENGKLYKDGKNNG
ncbi:hypothetical protein Q7A53_05340 [Halobacillus rhizosphaerae]|uniref:hypothetical protein n=1 Tax=Halobacillus rhizosphaerae TaxID=3064889 RepID=UPI00398B0F8B